MQYPREIYKSGQCRVIWGPEEHAAAKRDGWTDERAMSMEEASHIINSCEFIGVEIAPVQSEPKRRGRPPRIQQIDEVA